MPDPVTGYCPTNYEPCSKFTSPRNTYCVMPDKRNYCPITDVKLVSKQYVMIQDTEKPDYIEVPIDDFDENKIDWRLIYSKEYDSPYIVEFVLESLPPHPRFDVTETFYRVGDNDKDMLSYQDDSSVKYVSQADASENPLTYD